MFPEKFIEEAGIAGKESVSENTQSQGAISDVTELASPQTFPMGSEKFGWDKMPESGRLVAGIPDDERRSEAVADAADHD